LVFSVVPSETTEIYWRYTLKDIRVKLRLFMGNQQALIVQQFQTMATIVSQAFGSGKNKSDTIKPQTKEELTAAFGSVFS